MIRILIVDDLEKPQFIDELKSEVAESTKQPVEAEHLNPTYSFTGDNPVTELKAFLQSVERKAAEFWDLVLIDVNLNDVKIGRKDRLHLALSIASHVRNVNKTALVVLYSGTLEDHVKELLDVNESAETALKRIYRADIAAFSPRRTIVLQAIQSLSTPPFVLVVERALVEHASFVVADEEAEFRGKSLGQLAAAIRRQDPAGVRLIALVAQHGIAAIIDLNR